MVPAVLRLGGLLPLGAVHRFDLLRGVPQIGLAVPGGRSRREMFYAAAGFGRDRVESAEVHGQILQDGLLALRRTS